MQFRTRIGSEKIEECLQVPDRIEKLGEPDPFVDVVAGFHELGLYGTPDGEFQFRVYQFRRFALIDPATQTGGFIGVLDHTAKDGMPCPAELFRPVLFALGFFL